MACESSVPACVALIPAGGSVTIGISLLSGMITASIRRATGSVNGAFYVAIAAAAVGCACSLLMSKVKPTGKK